LTEGSGTVHLLRHLRPSLVALELESAERPPDFVEWEREAIHAEESGRPPPERPDFASPTDEVRAHRKRAVVEEIAGLFGRSGEIRNLHKFTRDFEERERKSTTAVGGGLAIPHIRSMQPRRLVVCLARSSEGAEFLAEDGEPVRVFFGIASPSYEDRDYWKLYRWAANAFNQESWLIDAIMDAPDADEIVRLFKGLR
jgi:mannitol/fructose-specific phosphotransferase system IIA component (Ntr-type)